MTCAARLWLRLSRLLERSCIITPMDVNDHRVRNAIITDINEFGGFDWPDDDEPVDLTHLQNVVANLVRLAQVLAAEIDELRAELNEARGSLN